MTRTTKNAIKVLSKQPNKDVALINAIAMAESLIHQVKDGYGKVMCKKGCGHCCNIPHVPITETEMRYMKRYMTEHGKVFKAYAGDDRCPLVDGNECSVYPARPLYCRGWYSRDVSWCEQPPRKWILRDESTPISFRAHLAAKSIHDALCHVIKEKPSPMIEAVGRI